ncbi:hypothetical protein [Nocardia aurantia]|uniref:DUF4254 domain-containing protein n=1 Tax=Nocardia aurantia TaxID=2585199 RepID=A0A7K0DT19_9NOCA|nr:hypothetical protein [Nocardia aurantia]MQY28901.1 hypothetical protein [Nocardia aurantia]
MILPDKDAVLAACRGFPGRHPMLIAARDLSVWHERERFATGPLGTNEMLAQRSHLRLQIDRWVALRMPTPFERTRIHTEGMGRVVDRLAMRTIQVRALLPYPASGAVRDAISALVELSEAYQDLADEVAAGLCRLPTGYDPW